MADETNTSSWKFWQRKAPSDGFPLCDLGSISSYPAIRYARMMYSAGHGLAAWTPLSSPTSQSWSRNGVTLGDVGYLDNGLGSFRHLFNVFHDRKVEGQSVARIPDNFVPLEPPFEQWEVRTTPDYFPKGAVITSEGVETSRLSEDALNFTFSCPVDEGSILILPKGGSREDLVVTDALYDYIAKQALEWFQFMDGYNKDTKTPTIANGNLCLVTGVDKVPEWSVFTFWREGEKKPEEPLTVKYNYGGSDPWKAPQSRSHSIWQNHCPEEAHDYLATAFVRGVRIALSPTAWAEYLPTDIYDSIYNVPTGPGNDPSTVTPASFVRSLRKIQPERVREVAFHPSFIIIQMMLWKVPKKDWPRLIAVDDALWYPFAQGKYLNWTVTVDLIAQIFKMNKIVHREGVMYLAPQGEPAVVGQAESILQRILSYLSEDIQRRAEVYLTTRAIKQAVKVVVFERKVTEEEED